MYLIRKHSSASNILRVMLRNSSTGAGLTGLTSASSGLIISTICDVEASATTYTVAGSTIESITTLGTFAAPTATKCRFKEVDATNHPGLYELQLADARFSVSNAKTLRISLTGAASLITKDITLQLSKLDPDDVVRGGLTSLPNAAADAYNGLWSGASLLKALYPTKGDVWFVTNAGNNGNDGKSWATAKLTVQAAATASAAGDTILIAGTFAEDVIVSSNRRLILSQGSSITGAPSGHGTTLELGAGSTLDGGKISGEDGENVLYLPNGDVTVTGTTISASGALTGTMVAGDPHNLFRNCRFVYGAAVDFINVDQSICDRCVFDSQSNAASVGGSGILIGCTIDAAMSIGSWRSIGVDVVAVAGNSSVPNAIKSTFDGSGSDFTNCTFPEVLHVQQVDQTTNLTNDPPGVASILTAITNLNNLSALMNLYGSPLLEIPDSSTTQFAFTMVVRDSEGKLVDLDASPTIAAANAAGTSRTANLSAVSHPATGRYTFTYGVASAAAEESLRITCSGAVSAEGRYIEWIGAVVNYDTLTTLSAVKAKTDLIPAGGFPANFSSLLINISGHISQVTNLFGHTPQTGDSYAIVSSNLDAAISSRSTLTQAQVTGGAWPIAADGSAGHEGEVVITINDQARETISDGVWNEPQSGYIGVAGSMGQAVAKLAVWFSGITSLANWLRNGFRKGNEDATATTEINGDNGTGTGTFSPASDSQEALRDRGDAAWTTGSGGGGGGVGDGDVTVTHNYGGIDALRVVNANSNPVDQAVIRAYVTADFADGTIDPNPPATRTGSDGRWLTPLMLDADTYTVTVLNPATKQTDVFTLVVA